MARPKGGRVGLRPGAKARENNAKGWKPALRRAGFLRAKNRMLDQIAENTIAMPIPGPDEGSMEGAGSESNFWAKAGDPSGFP